MLSPHTPVHEQRLKGLRSGSFWLGQQSSKKANDYTNALYKTELCRSFNDAGYCRYGLKCRFAHGMEDLRPVSRHKKYKTEPCKNYSRDGICPYGNRCRFVHEDDPQEMLARARSASFSSPRSPSPSSSIPLMDLARLDFAEGKQAGYELSYESFPARSNRARSVSFHSLYSTSVSTSSASLSTEKEGDKETDKVKVQEKEYDLSFGARMGAQPPAAHMLLGKSVEPFMGEIPPSFRYYDDHSPSSLVSSLRSASPSRSSQSSLKISQAQPQLASPSPSLSPSLTPAPLSYAPRPVFQPTPFKSIVGFTPTQPLPSSVNSSPPAAHGGWTSDSTGLPETTGIVKETIGVNGSGIRDLPVSMSSLSLSLARSPATMPKSSVEPSNGLYPSPTAPWPQVSLHAEDANAHSVSPPRSASLPNGVLRNENQRLAEKLTSSVIPPIVQSAPVQPVASPTTPELTLDLFAAASISKRLPIFATLTLSPKKGEPLEGVQA